MKEYKVAVIIQPLSSEHLSLFKRDMQDAFQQGAIDGFGKVDEQILPESHIDHSLNTMGAVAYEAILDGELVGGAIVVINDETKHGHLDFLYVKNGIQGKGIGQVIWRHIEACHPQITLWETVTPYFDRRNIHFYINRLGFHAVEFFWKGHKDPHHMDKPDDLPDNEYFDRMFRFEKLISK